MAKQHSHRHDSANLHYQDTGSGTGAFELVDRAWSKDVDEIFEMYHTDLEQGLGEEEVKKRRRQFGRNKLKQVERESTLSIFVRQFKSLIMLVLALAAALSFVFQQWIDGAGILIALFVNAFIGFFTELQAVRSMEALQQMDVKYTTVRRNDKAENIKAEEVVPGDIALIESGDVVTADIRLFEANRLQVNESALTGESVPVQKQTEMLAADVPLAERTNMLYKGTAVTEGSGTGIVVATGMETELGAVASMVQEAESEEDPLKKRLDALTTQLVRIIIAVAAVAAVAGIIAGKELFIMIETSIALFVAAVPEGLPIVATLALARGMHRMAKRNALVRRLSAVQTLGSTNVVFTDKTGTLTENQMTVTDYLLDQGGVEVTGEGLSTEGSFCRAEAAADHNQAEGKLDPTEDTCLAAALRVGVLCNNGSFENGDTVGDPMEVALLVAGRKAGLSREQLVEEFPEVQEVAFDPDLKMMATFHQAEEGYYEAVKGAPQAVLSCTKQVLRRDGSIDDITPSEREQWQQHNETLAENGLRVLALAERTVESPEVEPYEGLTFIGLVGLLDPPRDDVRDAIEVCHEAGVEVVMVTGDQKPTAVAIGKDLGIGGDAPVVYHGQDLEEPQELSEDQRRELLNGSIFYRVSPEQKLNLIDLHQQAGSIVAMTGDGVNDAPALKKADIGVAMGLRGEPVAEDAADILLQDDRFATINAAIEYGRIIFENIRKFVLYMISGNIGEIIIVLIASLAGAPLPLLPLQILYINAVNDIFPALALGLGPGSGTVMKRPPRDPSEPIMSRSHWYGLGAYGVLIGLSVLLGFALCLTTLEMDVDKAVTISFLSIAFARLWHVFNMRDSDSRLFINQITRNRFVWAALALCVGLLLLAVYVGPIATALDVVHPGQTGWLLIIGISLVPLILGQLGKWIVYRWQRQRQ
jgi:Ca2+-transporting ATPase